MSNHIDYIRINGFRSLREIELAGLPRAAVIIGANGSGKSNFIRFFEMVSWMIGSGRLGEFVQRQGGADDQLFGGSKVTPVMEAKLTIETENGRNDYRFALTYGHPDRFIFTDEAFRFSRGGRGTEATWEPLGSGHSEAKIIDVARHTEVPGVNRTTARVNRTTARVLVYLLRQSAVYQFHDTSADAQMKKTWDVNDNTYLRSHGGNLAAILLRLEREERDRFDLICNHVRRALPIFDQFVLEEVYGKVILRWKASGIDKTIGAHLTSDGSLRFFALVTLLNLPPEMLPDVVLLDEPELGLHPAAVALIGDMIKVCSAERQVIVATQSPLLVDAFDIDEIIVLELEEGQTSMRRCTAVQYQRWLNEYETGELWQKNVLGGRP